ncbi:MAG: hypothetical protein A4E57_04874 [Syntrophorhabdaceae bacterium PtaU1.Bin034]|nr:MAG: hypothetical protein A4E57_04874 [Syntrophorhabdaceae bacterium PtaU1.Bin034]
MASKPFALGQMHLNKYFIRLILCFLHPLTGFNQP